MLAIIIAFFDKLLEAIFLDAVKGKMTDYLDRRNVERTISRCAETPAQALESYFRNEGVAEEKLTLILDELQYMITSLGVDAKMLASASLNAEKLAQIILSEYPISEKIKEAELEWPFQMALQISTDALCNIGPRFKEWEKEAWRRNFEAFDKLLQNQEAIIRAVGPGGEGSADKRFEHTYRSHILRKLAQIDASTLRVSPSFFLDLATVFVQPEVIKIPPPTQKSTPAKKTCKKIISLEEARQLILSRSEQNEKPKRIQVEKFITKQKHKRCAIVGLPGTGKTTLLQHILVASAKTEMLFHGMDNIIPVLIRARELNLEDLPAIDELVQATQGKVLSGACPDGFLLRAFQDGRVLLLIDGLDEIVIDKRDNLITWISDLSVLYPECRYIVSSRPAGYQSDVFQKLHFDELHLCEFNSDQIREYVRRWTKAVEIAEGLSAEEADKSSSEYAQALVDKAERNPYVQRIATNPLMLSTLCLVQRYEGGDLPNRRVILYQRCVEGLLFHWDNKRKLSSSMLGSLQLEHKMLLLRRLALEMQIKGVAEITEDEIKESFTQSLHELGQRISPEVILSNIRDRSGLLVERRPEIYGFSHLTFQEYLAALSIHHGDYSEYDRMFLFSKRLDTQWSEVIALYAGIGPRDSIERLLKELIKTKDTSATILAGECAAAAQNVGANTQKQVIAKLLSLRNTARTKSQELLLSLDEHLVTGQIIEALRKKNRINSYRIIYRKPSPDYLDALFELGARVIKGKQEYEEYDYAVSLLLFRIKHPNSVKFLNKLAGLALKETNVSERVVVIGSLFSYEMFTGPLNLQKEALPGVFSYFNNKKAIKEQIDLCKYIEQVSSLEMLRVFAKSHPDWNLRRDHHPSSNILHEIFKQLKELERQGGSSSLKSHAALAATKLSIAIQEIDGIFKEFKK